MIIRDIIIKKAKLYNDEDENSWQISNMGSTKKQHKKNEMSHNEIKGSSMDNKYYFKPSFDSKQCVTMLYLNYEPDANNHRDISRSAKRTEKQRLGEHGVMG